jgi:hypothetical protein
LSLEAQAPPHGKQVSDHRPQTRQVFVVQLQVELVCHPPQARG